MIDFNFVTARLATGGGIASSYDVDTLAASGITAIVDCRLEVDDQQFLGGHPTIQYWWAPTLDDGFHKPPEWFAKGLIPSLGVLALPHQKVYAHCAEGRNRGPSMAAAILMALGLTKDEALRLIRAARPQATVAYASDAEAAVRALGYA